MNNDLISRSSLKKEFQDRLSACEDWINHTECDISRAIATRDFCIEVIMTIKNAPTVDLKDIYQEGHYDGQLEGYTRAINEERPQGEWILEETDCDSGGNNRYECSECHYSDIHSESAEVPYCWHCGAEMNGIVYRNDSKGGAE